MHAMILTALATVALILSPVNARAAAPLENIKVSYAVLSAAYMDHVTAMERGYFRDEGLNVEVLRMGGGGGDAGAALGAVALQQLGGLVVERGGARRAGEDRLHQFVAAQLLSCGD